VGVPSTTRRLAVVLVASCCLLGVAAPALAAEDPRQRPGSVTPPVTVYVSEELDISDVRMTGGGQITDDDRVTPRPVTFERVNGTENFTVQNPEEANFTGVAPGSYDAAKDGDGEPELEVVQPRVTRLTLQNSNAQNVTGERVRRDRLRAVTVVAEYDFDEADRLQVTMRYRGEDVGLNQRAAQITESGGRYTIGMRDRPLGEYTVVVTGSAIEAGTRSATVELTATDPTPTPTATATPTPTSTPTPVPSVTPLPSTPTPTATATPTPTPTTTATPTPTPTATATADDGPGPGLVGAVLAVLAAALVAVRRD
jgi:hypothetical protein